VTGWAGGAANYRWQRDRRGPDDGRLRLREDVTRILTQFRKKPRLGTGHDLEPVPGRLRARTREPAVTRRVLAAAARVACCAIAAWLALALIVLIL
jgi:hypothetical protein